MPKLEGLGVLVTGASGFVGGWLARELVRRDARVVALVRDADPIAFKAHPDLWERIVRVSGDVTDLQVLRRALSEYDIKACFHLAAQAKVQSALVDPVGTFETNVRGTYMLLEACRLKADMNCVVVASSDKAYGEQKKLPYDEVDSPLVGGFPYDASKSAADLIARSYATTFGMPVAVTRSANIYGGGDLDLRRIVPATIAAALAGRRPLIRSDGTPERDYLYIEDVVEAYLALAGRLPDEGITGGAFNFGSGVPVRVIDLVRLILKLMESELEPEILGTAKAEISRQYLSSKKAERDLGWRPRFVLEEGLRETIEWYKGNSDLIPFWQDA